MNDKDELKKFVIIRSTRYDCEIREFSQHQTFYGCTGSWK
jgi:hypothetical protein